MTLDEFIEQQKQIYNVGKSAFWDDMKVIGREIAKATISSVTIKSRIIVYNNTDKKIFNEGFNDAVEEFENKARDWIG